MSFVREAPCWKALARHIRIFASSRARVLITGETGTGKELVAHEIHRLSPRKDGPFVAINCAAVPETLIEAELFGHERGSFTGAFRQSAGVFEQADGGTLFLDEIGELPLGMQGRLLRVLADPRGKSVVRRIGGKTDLTFDIRVIAATNCDVTKAVKEKRLRPDLYYRLKVLQIDLPPLRDRKEDIHPLIEFFVNNFAIEMGAEVTFRPDPEGLRVLREYPWPGNVRELQNLVEQGVVLREEFISEISASELVKGLKIDLEENMCSPLIQAEKDVILEAVSSTGWNVKAAAKVLCIPRSTLIYKMRRLGLTEVSEKTMAAKGGK